MTRPLRLALGTAALACAVTACESHTIPIPNPFGNPVFPAARAIRTASPGDGCVVGTRPYFVWQATGRPLVHVAVFSDNIDVAPSGRIANTEANVWVWHSGLGTGSEGSILFEHGRDVRDGVVQEGPPTPLEQGGVYAWAVWAWNDAGTQVTNASAEIFFTVDTTRVGCPPAGP